MPRKPDPNKLVPVMVRFSTDEVAFIDSRRGAASRSAFVRTALVDQCTALVPRRTVPLKEANPSMPSPLYVHPSTPPASSECVHLRDQRKKLPYGTLCQACNTMVPR